MQRIRDREHCKLRFSVDTCLTRAYKEVMVVTAYIIGQNWNTKEAIIKFGRFYTTYTREVTKAFPKHIMKKYNFAHRVQAITTDSGPDEILGVSLLHKCLFRWTLIFPSYSYIFKSKDSLIC